MKKLTLPKPVASRDKTSGKISVTLDNLVMADFIKYLECCKFLRDSYPDTEYSSRMQKYVSMAVGQQMWDLYLPLRAKYERYSIKPKFNFKITNGQAASLMLCLHIEPAPLSLYNELIQIDLFV